MYPFLADEAVFTKSPLVILQADGSVFTKDHAWLRCSIQYHLMALSQWQLFLGCLHHKVINHLLSLVLSSSPFGVLGEALLDLFTTDVRNLVHWLVVSLYQFINDIIILVLSEMDALNAFTG